MDTDDVSNIGQFTQSLDAQKTILKAAMVREGQLPTDRKARSELIDKHEMMTMQTMMRRFGQNQNQNQNQNQMQIQSSLFPPPYPPSTASLDELKPIYIKDLRLGIHHRGNYLLVRSVTAPNRMTAIMAIVEDEKQDALVIQLYQQPDENVRPALSIITNGDVFLLKEPFFKIMGDGEYGLRIDHVSDLVRIDARHELWPKQWIPHLFNLRRTADDWKQEGNVAMGRKKYWEAIQSYTTALASHPSTSEETVIRLNRALAYLQDESFEAALADTQCLGPTSNASEKALYRAGKALYGLGRFSQCCDILQTLCEKYPNNFAAAKELARARLRLSEQQCGTYDFKTIYKEVSEVRPPHLDHATFIGPVVVKTSPDRGRGLFTTKAVKAGELLLCEQAFAHCYAGSSEESSKSASNIKLLVNIHTNRMTMGTQGDLITAIVQKLWRNPSLLSEFATLHHGSYEPVCVTEVDGKPVIDTFLVERVISLNSFGCALTTKENRLHATKESENRHHSCGVWPMASRINHSCVSNVRRSFIGDLQIIRATCHIPADTELTFWYKIPTGDYYEMQKGLEHWGFQCKCAICLDSKNTPKKLLKRRNYLLGDLKATLNATNVNTVKAERILNTIGQTYTHPPTDVPQLVLREPYARLALIYYEQRNAEKVVATSLKALESLGFMIKGAQLPLSPVETFRVEKWGIMVDDVINMWVHLWNAYSAFAPHLLPQAADCGKLAYNICVGEDVTFNELFDKQDNLK